MSYAAGIIFTCLAVAIIIGMVYQALAYARGRHIITRGQLRLRMATGVLLLLTIAMVFYAALVKFTHPVTALVFWGLLTLLPLAVIILTWLDLRQVARTQHQRQAEIYRGLAHLERDVRRKPDGQDRP